MRCLDLNAKHAGCLHVMGMWNAEVRRLNGFTRAIAQNLMGGQVFRSATWEQAISYMERAVAEEPNRIAHRIDLAEVYRDTGKTDKARIEFEAVLKLPAADGSDAGYKVQAREALRKL
ncbi:MAG: tetratricopeptide repeat protein, partial [Gemmatimonadaceae bacterium]|nr:tetratricopeptide repeat protein [Gemmatimonadaceae bacterium]